LRFVGGIVTVHQSLLQSGFDRAGIFGSSLDGSARGVGGAGMSHLLY